MPVSHYDLIIVGGGMVGLALASKLANASLSIAIVEAKEVQQEWQSTDYDLRVSAITRATEKLLKSVGAWHFIDSLEATPYQKMLVWDGESSQGRLEFDAHSIAQANLGHIIENRVLRRALYKTIEGQASIDWLCPETCAQLEYREEAAELTLTSGQIIKGKLLVAADGAFSWLRQQSGVELETRSYHHKAIVCTIMHQKPHSSTAYQRFDSDGPLAFLPLPEQHKSSIVWSVKEHKAEPLLALDDQAFSHQLGLRFEQWLGQVKLISKRVCFPLYERMSEALVKHRLALVGDAAHTIHPLAGQGVNLGFADVEKLAEIILSNNMKGKDIGKLSSLRPYERARKGEIVLMKQSMLAFKTLFETEEPIVQMARSLGMAITDKHPLIKQQLIKKALGL